MYGTRRTEASQAVGAFAPQKKSALKTIFWAETKARRLTITTKKETLKTFDASDM